MTTGPRRVPGASRAHGLRGRLAGPWRVAVAELSMARRSSPVTGS